MKEFGLVFIPKMKDRIEFAKNQVKTIFHAYNNQADASSIEIEDEDEENDKTIKMVSTFHPFHVIRRIDENQNLERLLEINQNFPDPTVVSLPRNKKQRK